MYFYLALQKKVNYYERLRLQPNLPYSSNPKGGENQRRFFPTNSDSQNEVPLFSILDLDDLDE